MSAKLSLRAYAASRKARGLPGGTLNAVQKARDAGRIQVVDGKVDQEAADAAWAANTSVEQQQRGKSGGVKRPKASNTPKTGVDEGADEPNDDAEAERYLNARARKEAALADLAQMEAAEARGDLVRVEDVAAWWGEMVTLARARLLALPSMAAPQVAAPGKIAEVQAILRKLINEALEELSRDGVPEGAAGRARRHAGHLETAA